MEENKKEISKKISKKEILDELHKVSDPEINESIVDLGLVYDVKINESTKEIKIDMTLTSPACPLGGYIISEIHEKMQEAFKEYKTEVDVVFEPRWTPELMKGELRERFSFLLDGKEKE